MQTDNDSWLTFSRMRSLTLESRTDGELGVRPSRLWDLRASLNPETEVVTWLTCAVDCSSPLSRASNRRPRAPVTGSDSLDSSAADGEDVTTRRRRCFFQLSRFCCCCWGRSSSGGVAGKLGTVWRRTTLGLDGHDLRSWLVISTTSKSLPSS